MKQTTALEAPKKILIVEDEVDMLQALVEVFERAGFEITTAMNGKEGVDMALKEHPDLILLDIVMPQMDGMAMMKIVRADAWGKDVPIIILTNLSASEKILEGVVVDKPLYYLVKSDWKLADIVTSVQEKLKLSS